MFLLWIFFFFFFLGSNDELSLFVQNSLSVFVIIKENQTLKLEDSPLLARPSLAHFLQANVLLQILPKSLNFAFFKKKLKHTSNIG